MALSDFRRLGEPPGAEVLCALDGRWVLFVFMAVMSRRGGLGVVCEGDVVGWTVAVMQPGRLRA